MRAADSNPAAHRARATPPFHYGSLTLAPLPIPYLPFFYYDKLLLVVFIARRPPVSILVASRAVGCTAAGTVAGGKLGAVHQRLLAHQRNHRHQSGHHGLGLYRYQVRVVH